MSGAGKVKVTMKCPHCDGKGEIDISTATVGDMILSKRKGKGWTQQNLCERVGMSRAQIANIESGRSDMPLKTLWRFAEAFGCRMSELVP